MADGSVITNKGRALIAKLMAAKTPLLIDSAQFGSGQLPLGVAPSAMTGLANHVMDAVIADGYGPTNQEAKVTLQALSSEVTEEKDITEAGVFAIDPDEGKILYCYAPLQDDPITLKPSAIKKLLELEIYMFVDAVEKVIVNLNPNAFVRREELEQYAKTIHSHEIADVKGLQTALDGKAPAKFALDDLPNTDTPPMTGFALPLSTILGTFFLNIRWVINKVKSLLSTDIKLPTNTATALNLPDPSTVDAAMFQLAGLLKNAEDSGLWSSATGTYTGNGQNVPRTLVFDFEPLVVQIAQLSGGGLCSDTNSVYMKDIPSIAFGASLQTNARTRLAWGGKSFSWEWLGNRLENQAGSFNAANVANASGTTYQYSAVGRKSMWGVECVNRVMSTSYASWSALMESGSGIAMVLNNVAARNIVLSSVDALETLAASATALLSLSFSQSAMNAFLSTPRALAALAASPHAQRATITSGTSFSNNNINGNLACFVILIQKNATDTNNLRALDMSAAIDGGNTGQIATSMTNNTFVNVQRFVFSVRTLSSPQAGSTFVWYVPLAQ